MFFGQFPTLRYENKYVIKNLFRSVVTEMTTAENFSNFFEHYIMDGERPDLLANKFYSHPKYDWVILLVNNMSERDWPMTERQLHQYLDKTYGTDRFAIRHYERDGHILQGRTPIRFEDENGEEIGHYFNPGFGLGAQEGDYIVANGRPVTNEEYEIERNEAKRRIRILKNDHLNSFVTEFQQKVA